MTKYGAFGVVLNAGIRQVETATVVVPTVITLGGNATVVTTCTGMSGTPITTNVAVLLNDTADTVANKIRIALALDANITALFDVGGGGAQVVLTKKVAGANIANLNISTANGTCTGITTQATSVDTIAGVAQVAIAQVKNITPPNLSMDTEDVTTHDSPGAWEQIIATILRSGEVGMELVYDPGGTTHNATAGMLFWMKNKTRVQFDLIFRSTYNWVFDGVVTAFESDAPHDGALTASATIKVDGVPTLE